MRDANGVVPLFLAGGRAAVAWTDNAGLGSLRDFPRGGGRLHLAVDGAPRAAGPAPPRLTISGRRSRRLFASQALPVTVRCDRACDVRARLAGSDVEYDAVSASRSSAGPLRLRVPVTWLSDDEARRLDARVVVRATAPGGERVVRAALRTRIIIRRALPVPRPIALRARRAGRDVIVAWRTRRPARRVWFLVAALRARRGEPVDEQALEYLNGRGRTRFRVVLRPRRPGAVRWVNVAGYSIDGSATRTNRVRVR